MSGNEDAGWQWIKAVQSAMRDEQIDEMTVGRVINRLVYGDPAGSRAQREEGQQVHVHITSPAPDASILRDSLRAAIRHGNRLRHVR